MTKVSLTHTQHTHHLGYSLVSFNASDLEQYRSRRRKSEITGLNSDIFPTKCELSMKKSFPMMKILLKDVFLELHTKESLQTEKLHVSKTKCIPGGWSPPFYLGHCFASRSSIYLKPSLFCSYRHPKAAYKRIKMHLYLQNIVFNHMNSTEDMFSLAEVGRKRGKIPTEKQQSWDVCMLNNGLCHQHRDAGIPCCSGANYVPQTNTCESLHTHFKTYSYPDQLQMVTTRCIILNFQAKCNTDWEWFSLRLKNKCWKKNNIK